MKRLSPILVFPLAATMVAGQLAKPGTFWLWDIIERLLKPSITHLFEGTLAMMKMNPRVFCLPEEIRHGCTVDGGIDVLMPYFLDILVPLYIIALMFTAMYFLVKGGSPRGRARSKAMLSKLIFGTVLVAMAPILYQTMLDISSALVEWISEEFLDLDDFGIFAGSGICCPLLVGIVVLVFAAVSVALRYFFVLIFAILFPFLLFLYFFDLTRGFGRKWLRRAVAWIFTPVVQTLFLVFTIVAMQSVAPMLSSEDFTFIGQSATLFMAMVGMLMVGITPLIMGKLYGFIGGGITAFGLVSNIPWLAGLGALVEGRRENAIELTLTVMLRASYANMALSYAQTGGARSFGPSSPAPTVAATGGEPPAPSSGKMSKKEAGKAAEAEVKAMRESAESGPIGLRKRKGSVEDVEPPRISVGGKSADTRVEKRYWRGMRVSKGEAPLEQPIKDGRRLVKKLDRAVEKAGLGKVVGEVAENVEEMGEGVADVGERAEGIREDVEGLKRKAAADIPRLTEEERKRGAGLLGEGKAKEEVVKSEEMAKALREEREKRKGKKVRMRKGKR